MTEPKKEECEACYGSGYINFRTDDGHISMRTCRRCDGYGYIKAKPMTNEEYIHSLNTEQLAEWLRGVYWHCHEIDCEHCNYPWRCMEKGDIVEWLKQPHTKE